MWFLRSSDVHWYMGVEAQKIADLQRPIKQTEATAGPVTSDC